MPHALVLRDHAKQYYVGLRVDFTTEDEKENVKKLSTQCILDSFHAKNIV